MPEAATTQEQPSVIPTPVRYKHVSTRSRWCLILDANDQVVFGNWMLADRAQQIVTALNANAANAANAARDAVIAEAIEQIKAFKLTRPKYLKPDEWAHVLDGAYVMRAGVLNILRLALATPDAEGAK